MDKFEKLLEECKEFVADDPIYYGLELSTKEVAIVVEALEKQVAKKPEIYIGEYEFERWPICPKCKGELHSNGEKFCSDCGQRIDRGDIE